jgi:dienelactone hydrolase
MLIKRTCPLACALLLTGLLAAESAGPIAKPLPGDVMIDTYLKEETKRLSTRFLDGAKTLREWEARKPRLHREYLDMLGLWPLPKKTPLHAKVTGTVERGPVVIEKLHFQSRPGLYVTGNLYRQRKPAGRLPTILYVCGHSGRGRDGNKTAFQDHGMWFARNGYVCLIVDTLQLGEVAGKHHGTYNLGRWWWQARGYTPAGVECWNGIRALDYLVSRPDVDPDKLGVTGISGGGASTIWIAAADERVKVAVPVSGMSDLESYVSHKVINGHCDCMFVYNTYQWEWTTIIAQIAPRPLLFANSDHDPIFPMDGNRRIIARLRRLYKMYGKPELVDDYVSKGGHDYRPDLRVAVFRWINKHLKGETGPVKDATDRPLPGKQLRVFPEDRDIPKDAINSKIDQTFVPKAEVKLPKKGEFAGWKKGLMKGLRERSFRPFPERVPKVLKSVKGGRLPFEMETERGIEVIWLDPPFGEAAGTPTFVVTGLEDGEYEDVKRWVTRRWGEFKGVGVLDPRGVAFEWTRKSPPNYVERAHALLGRTVDQGRVYDIISVARSVRRDEKTPCRIIGRGRNGILAAYAALFEPSITEVIVVDPPASHGDGPIFLNVLRVLDVPEALGLLAPRPLTLIGAKDRAFDRTEAIYKAAGAADKLKRK